MTHALVPTQVHTHAHQHTHTRTFPFSAQESGQTYFQVKIKAQITLSFKSAQAALSLGTSAAVRRSRPGPAGWGVWCSLPCLGRSPAPSRAVCVSPGSPSVSKGFGSFSVKAGWGAGGGGQGSGPWLIRLWQGWLC